MLCVIRRAAKSPRARRPARGTVSSVVALTLPLLVGVAAIALDGGMLYSAKRQVQAATDAAALAAGYSLYNNYATNQGLDPKGTAKAAALALASDNGYNYDGTTSSVTVNIPPTSGTFSGQSGYAEIYVTSYQPRYFSALWGSGTLPVTSRAVARGTYATASGYAILVLDKSSSGSLQVGNSQGGGSKLTTTGGGIQVDSTSATAVTMSNNGTITTPQINICGSYSLTGSSTINGTKNTGASSVSDPLSSLSPPSTSSLTVQTPPNPNAYYPITLNPGVYPGGLTLSGGGSSVTMNPGIYYMQNGGFSVSNGVPVTGSGVMIYIDNGGGALNLMNGGGSINISPPTSGTYAGISIYQNRSNTNTLNFGNGSTVKISGTIYAAGAMIQYTEGNSSNVYGSQIISKQLQVIDGAAVSVSYSSANVARQRATNIVE